MLNISTDISNLDEIIKKNWPTQGTDAAPQDDSDWEILNDSNSNNENNGTNRHWFKQNFINKTPPHSRVIYH